MTCSTIAVVLFALVNDACFVHLGASNMLGSSSCGSEDDDVVKYAKKLSEDELIAFIEKLGRDQRYSALEALMRANIPHGSFAATMYCQILPPENAVAFCTTLPLGSVNWHAGMWGLKNHPREKVIGYIKQIATSSIPEARWRCYDVCITRQWDDLLPLAKSDLTNKTPVAIPKAFDATIADVARRYIREINRR
jgi:hypothetical protein